MKQYKIIASSKESEDFKMQIIAHENILFSELHQAIQSALEYDPLQMASFYLSNKNWERLDEIALIDMEDKDEVLLMDELKLSDKLINKNQNFLYLFDFFSERFLFLTIEELVDVSDALFSIEVEGTVPSQINIDDESIDVLMQGIDFPKTSENTIDDFDDAYNENDISFENIDDLEEF